MKTLFLVSCCGKKLARPAPASDLYLSPLFKLSRSVVVKELDKDPEASWGILSAEHGFILPDTELAPYDRTLTRLHRAELDGWGSFVALQLISSGYENHKIHVYAGVRYMAFRQYLPARTRVNTFNVLSGLEIGQRLCVLKTRLQELEST